MNSTESDSEDITKIIGKKFLINEWRDTTLKKVSGIYKITNKVNGKYYVGSSKDIFRRWLDHTSELEREVHHSDYLQRAWNKYKSSNFVFEIIELASEEKLKEIEQVYLNKAFIYENAEMTYNASPNSTGGKVLPEIMDKIKSCWTEEKRKLHAEKYIGNKNHFYGKTHNTNARQILSKKHTGKVLTNEHRENIRLATTGEKNPFYGKTHSDELKEKFSKERLGKNLGITNPNADHTIYELYNVQTNEFFTGTRSDFYKKYYPTRVKLLNDLITGRIKKRRDGWTLIK